MYRSVILETVRSSASQYPLSTASIRSPRISHSAPGLQSDIHSLVCLSNTNDSATTSNIQELVAPSIEPHLSNLSTSLDTSVAPLNPWTLRPLSHMGLITLVRMNRDTSSRTSRTLGRYGFLISAIRTLVPAPASSIPMPAMRSDASEMTMSGSLDRFNSLGMERQQSSGTMPLTMSVTSLSLMILLYSSVASPSSSFEMASIPRSNISKVSLNRSTTAEETESLTSILGLPSSSIGIGTTSDSRPP